MDLLIIEIKHFIIARNTRKIKIWEGGSEQKYLINGEEYLWKFCGKL